MGSIYGDVAGQTIVLCWRVLEEAERAALRPDDVGAFPAGESLDLVHREEVGRHLEEVGLLQENTPDEEGGIVYDVSDTVTRYCPGRDIEGMLDGALYEEDSL